MDARPSLRKGEHQQIGALKVVEVVVGNHVDQRVPISVPADGDSLEIVCDQRRNDLTQLAALADLSGPDVARVDDRNSRPDDGKNGGD